MKKKIYTLALALLSLFCSVDVMAQVEGLTPVTDLQNGQYYIYCTTTQKWLNDQQTKTFTEKPTTVWTLTDLNKAVDKKATYSLTSQNNHTFSIYNSTANEYVGVEVNPVATTYETKTGNDISLQFTINDQNGYSTIYRSSKSYPRRNWVGNTNTNGDRNVMVNQEDGTISIGADADQVWIFYTKAAIQEKWPTATAEEVSAYNAIMNGFIEKYNNLGFSAGQYAPYNNIVPLSAFAKFNNASQLTIGDLLPCKHDEFQNIIDDMKNWSEANSTDIEGIGNSDFVTFDGWMNNGSETNNLKTSGDVTGYQTNGIITYGNQPGYTLPLEANTKYVLEFSYAAGNQFMAYSSQGATVSVLNNNSERLKSSNYGDINGVFPNSITTQKVEFTTGAAGNYVITLESKNASVGTSGTVFTDVHLYKIFSGTEVKAANQWGTYVSQVERTIPEDVAIEAYTIEDTEGDKLVLSEATKTLVAGVPYLVKNTGEADATVPYVYAKDCPVQLTEASNAYCLKGVFEATQVNSNASNTNYVLSKQNDNLGFYRLASETTIPANRCYLSIPATSGNAKASFHFNNNGVVTAIEAINSLTNGETVGIYDINGAQQSDLKKGMNIVKFANGKTAKIIVK